MLESIIPSVISAGLNFFGGQQNRKLREEEIARQDAAAQRNIDLQREFAQNSIQWRKADAEKAGVNPHFALGAQGISFSPVSIGSAPEADDYLSRMGQDISRAAMANETQSGRASAITKAASALTLKNMELKNGLLEAQIRKINNPPMPEVDSTNPALDVKSDVPIPSEKPSELKRIYLGGRRFPLDPGTSSGQDIEDTLGDEGVPAWIFKNIAQAFHMKYGLGTFMDRRRESIAKDMSGGWSHWRKRITDDAAAAYRKRYYGY